MQSSRADKRGVDGHWLVGRGVVEMEVEMTRDVKPARRSGDFGLEDVDTFRGGGEERLEFLRTRRRRGEEIAELGNGTEVGEGNVGGGGVGGESELNI
jgi:hypothetical protein